MNVKKFKQETIVESEKDAKEKQDMKKVIKVHPDRAGLVRSAKVPTKTNVLSSPISKLCLVFEADN